MRTEIFTNVSSIILEYWLINWHIEIIVVVIISPPFFLKLAQTYRNLHPVSKG